MARYRKKPVVIEAFLMTRKRRWDNSEWPDWLQEAWDKKPGESGSFYCRGILNTEERVYIKTLEGEMTVTWGDFIIQGVKGEIYPCKPDIFAETYELVEEEKDERVPTTTSEEN